MSSPTTGFDSAALQRDLARAVSGPVSVDEGARGLYTTDASNYRHVPAAVVLPRSTEDLCAAIAVCRDHAAPVVLRGGGTSMAGQAVGTGVVIDTSRYLTRVLDVDPEGATARVEPGLVLTALQRELAPHGLAFGPDPSSQSRCTIAGMIGNNACGSHSVAWGTTADNVEELDVLLYDGTRLSVGAGDAGRRASDGGRVGALYAGLDALVQDNLALIRQGMPNFARRVSGYALDQLLPENGMHVARSLVGSEGTCAAVLGASVRLVRPPARRVLLVLGFPDVVAAADAAPALLPLKPLTVEGLNEELVMQVAAPGAASAGRALLPDGQAWLLVEAGGETEGAAIEAAQRLARAVGSTDRHHLIVADPRQQKLLWNIRRDGTGLATRAPDGTEAWPGWEDAAVPPARLAGYLRDFEALKRRHGLRGLAYGHFGEGCIHIRLDFDLGTHHGVARFRGFVEEAADLVVSHGGSLSGEHGDGQARAELLPRMYGAELVSLFGRYKALWDPADGMNPGVLVRPRALDANLRHGPETVYLDPPTRFAYSEDAGSFAQAVRRCVGIGKCRQTEGGVMCPSYMVTREEKHSTRGRAHLLGEMLNGELVGDGWRSRDVRDALDLCLSCKGCKSDCPVNVDMATYKAEFLHHHYARRLRPASHYSMGWLPLWARVASRAPRLVNRVTHSPISPLLRRMGGIAPERELPQFAEETFVAWFRRRSPVVGGARGPVLLWPDTFTNFLAPQVGRAAVEVLERAGYDVTLPDRSVCCGLTWVSTGQLGVAERVLRRSLRTLAPYVAEGVPVVGLEPSCTSLLRDEARELVPGKPSEDVAAHLYTFAELLTRHASGWSPPVRPAHAISQVHCHQHATLGYAADAELLARAGVDNTVLDSGCCGLAGNFGFEKGHYDVSQAAGERVLLPAVRGADQNTLVLADGFSCRTQVEQGTGRRPLHLAEVLNRAAAQA
jgi:FAD/FMN-containing dehydrogenase/Fe-S oxidoreductase